MRDRWVAIYILLVFAQLPLYYAYGEGPLKFEFAVKDAESQVQKYQGEKEVSEQIGRSLEEAATMLQVMDDQSSRDGRLKLTEGILAWKSGKPVEAMEALQKSYEVFVEKHGVDSFHAAALDVRLAELYYLQRQYEDSRIRYARSSPRVRDYLGPRHPFVVRMAFREVSALISLGRDEEAQAIAKENIGLLKLVAAEQDSQFLRSTGGALDQLHRKGKFEGAPESFETWKSYLNSLAQESASGTAKSSRKSSESDGF